MRFLSGDGSYLYTLRLVEFPQTDENRVYCTLDIEYLKTKVYADFRSQVDIFFQTGRFVMFRSLAYTDRDGAEKTVPFKRSLIQQYQKLGGEIPYYTLMTIDKPEEEIINSTFGANEATIIRGSSIIRGGKTADIPFAVRMFSYNDFTDTALTLDAGPLTFSKGDTIHLDMILLPWGTGLETDCENVRKVLADSAVNRLSISAGTGSVKEDLIVPTVLCKDNGAEFTVTGGGNNSVVRIGGFTQFGKLMIEEQTDGQWTPVPLASVWGYDGYGVQYEPDGTYTYSFVYDSDGSARTFRATIG
ncbi:MAG: hypothetical protein K6G90_02705 [Clostridia bacterium]|nr:hypothetical protein [Clostridia bacterium]